MLSSRLALLKPARRKDSIYLPLLYKKVPMSSSSELWMGCARWLRDLNLLTSEKNGKMTEFAAVLRDGILLCRLANILIPNSVDQKEIMKSQQQSQFTCFNNIDLFVEVCRTQFKMSESDLFTAGDLFHMTGFQKILKTLSILSNSEQSLAKGVDPFPEVDRNQQGTSSSRDFIDDEEIYQSLHDDIENINPDETVYGPITSTDPDVQESEKLYDRIVTTRKPSLNENDNTPAVKRNKCIRELYETEKNYVEHALVTIIKNFYEPLQKVIPIKDYNVIFGNIKEIDDLHKALLADLKYPVEVALGIAESMPRPTSLEDYSPQTIGEVFVKYRDQFLAYGKYCSNLPDSRKLSNELLKTNIAIAKSIEELTSQGNCKFGMNDLLCVPFQRLTKYPLLLKELVKKTDITSEDRNSLQEAVEVMEDVCAYINEESRDTNSKKVIDEIEQSITDLSMPPNVKLHDYGRVNHDGEIKMAESTMTQLGKPKQRYIFLFDKVIVVCKAASKVTTKDRSPGAKANTFTYKNAYIMSELSIDQNVSIDAKSGGTITRRTQYVIHMHRDRTDGNEIVQLSFYFKNEASRTNWLNALLLSKSNVCPTEALRDSNHKVNFTSFRVDVNKPTICGVCHKLMKGLRYQGYKCEVCRMEMHKDCLGLSRCESDNRRSHHEPRSSQSFNCSRARQNIHDGDIVTANSTCTPSDLTFLQFSKGDRIEVIQMQTQNRFTGRLVNNRNRTGLVDIFRVSPNRTTSMIGLSPVDLSPAGSIGPRVDRKESTVLPKRIDTMLSDLSLRSSSSHTTRSSRASSSSTINGSEITRQQQDYVNTEISEYLWYMGEMERAKAESTLKGTPNGTYLVRYSKNRKQTAISLSYKGDVKHMIIEQNKEGKVYLDEDYIFNSTVELVQYYREHNLIEIFQALDTCLKNPYLQCKVSETTESSGDPPQSQVYKAIHDYTPPAPNQDGKFLSLKTGDVVVLLDTVGEDRGWWKGQVNNKTGFFPLSYVKPYDPSADGISPSTPTSSSSS